MLEFPLLPLRLRRRSVLSAVSSSAAGAEGSRPWLPGFYRRWLRRRERAGLYIRVSPHTSAIVREPRYFVTHWTRLCGLKLRGE